MAKLPSMPLFVDDYEAATAHLTIEEDGCYMRLLRLCWRERTCTIPDNDEWIMRRMRVDKKTFRRLVKPILEEFFTSSKATVLPPHLLKQIPDEPRLFSPRLIKEHNYVSELSERRAQAGRKGGRAKALKNNGAPSSKATVLPEQTDSKSLAPTPTPIPREEAKASSSREDVNKLMIEACQAAGVDVPDPSIRWDRHRDYLGVVQGWLDAGATPEKIVEVITTRRRGKNDIRSLQFFDIAVREEAATLAPGSSVSRADMAMVEDILKRKALREAAERKRA